ncbi:hypothetical protein D3C85_1806320 [compost metagenome]
MRPDQRTAHLGAAGTGKVQMQRFSAGLKRAHGERLGRRLLLAGADIDLVIPRRDVRHGGNNLAVRRLQAVVTGRVFDPCGAVAPLDL